MISFSGFCFLAECVTEVLLNVHITQALMKAVLLRITVCAHY